jgi:hypothetical protein
MTTPGLTSDPYEEEIPAGVWSLWGHEIAAWHTPDWWRRHWELSGLLEKIETAWLPDGVENWILWAEAVREVSGSEEDGLLTLLHENSGQLGFVSATARKRMAAAP